MRDALYLTAALSVHIAFVVIIFGLTVAFVVWFWEGIRAR